MADPTWLTKIAKSYMIVMKCYSEFFGVTYDESELNIYKFKMSDAMWRIKMQRAESYATEYGVFKMVAKNLRNYPIMLKMCIRKFFVPLVTNLTFDSRISR